MKYIKHISVISLAALMVAASPTLVHADSTDAPFLADMLANQVKELANEVQAMLQQAGLAGTTAAGNVLNATVAANDTQATVDAQERASLDVAQLRTATDYTMHAKTAKSCSTVQGGASWAAMNAGVKSFSTNMASAVNQTVGARAETDLQQACASGYIDTAENPDLAKLGCAPATDPARVNADEKWSTVTSSDQLQVPAGITMQYGRMGLPAISSLSNPNEKAYIDALTVCVNLRGGEPASVAGLPGNNSTISPTLGLMARDSQRRALLMTAPAFDSCIGEVNRRARIGKALAYHLGGNFQTQYTAELGACTSAHDLGEMSDTEFADCQTNGRSLAEVEKLQINRWSSATWQQGLLQNKQIPPVEVAKMVENGRDMATLISLQREQNQLLLAILENTKPTTNAPMRNPMDTAVSK